MKDLTAKSLIARAYTYMGMALVGVVVSMGFAFHAGKGPQGQRYVVCAALMGSAAITNYLFAKFFKHVEAKNARRRAWLEATKRD
jgi:hypothetical protein